MKIRHPMKTYVFDTFGTTVLEKCADELNNTFFQYGTRFGYNSEELKELAKIRKNNPKDLAFIESSALGKIRLLQEGLYTTKFFPDVEPTFKIIKECGDNIIIFSKGSLGVVKEIYRQSNLLPLIDGVFSSSEFSVADKTNPDCYRELEKIFANKGETISSYVSDDFNEVTGFITAFPNKPGYLIDRSKEKQQKQSFTRIKTIQRLEEVLK